MSEHSKDFVTTGTCKIVTDATNAKIDAQAVLFDAKLQSIKDTVKTTGAVLGIVFTVIAVLLKFWRP
jgi:hypothetical protein